MAARKLQQEVDKCFKKVLEGVAEFDAIYEKIEQSNNTAQKEKLEDNLKREIKKLQRLRDQIKTWAAGNEIKDKGPLMENRRLIETQMERFKAVEKAMKTKAYSKEGLSAATKLDPKEQAKLETGDFLSSQVDELEQQIESLEAEAEGIQATAKRGKMHGAKAERMAEIERVIERHKWHQGRLELIRRSLENGGVEVDQVNDLEESIRYYVTDNMNNDFMEDDTMYDDLKLDENEDAFGMVQDNDKGSSQDNQSIQDDAADTLAPEGKSGSGSGSGSGGGSGSSGGGGSGSGGGSGKGGRGGDSSSGRRPCTQLKSPLPALATLHTPLPSITNGNASAAAVMRPASIPARPASEGLKYASAAAAAAASDKLNCGIAPLPPPPGSSPAVTASTKLIVSNSPKPAAAQTASNSATDKATASPTISTVSTAGSVSGTGKSARGKAAQAAAQQPAATTATAAANGSTNGFKTASSSTTPAAIPEEVEGVSADTAATSTTGEEESIYHLPASLQDLVEAMEVTKSQTQQNKNNAAYTLRVLEQSAAQAPLWSDAEPTRRYVPTTRFQSASNYPQEPLALLDDPRLYGRVDSDTLFYVFYYKQGTYQQYLAAKALKDMSWRFHKQYQTWFQRHEEPKSITEEFEQGTYRFFDYESTWMNRRKADFKFVYKYLEDDV